MQLNGAGSFLAGVRRLGRGSELGRRVGIDRRTVSALVLRSRKPSLELVWRLHEMTGIKVHDLVEFYVSD